MDIILFIFLTINRSSTIYFALVNIRRIRFLLKLLSDDKLVCELDEFPLSDIGSANSVFDGSM